MHYPPYPNKQVVRDGKQDKTPETVRLDTPDRRCVCASESLLLTDQTPDSGNPPLICCHGVVL